MVTEDDWFHLVESATPSQKEYVLQLVSCLQRINDFVRILVKIYECFMFDPWHDKTRMYNLGMGLYDSKYFACTFLSTCRGIAS